MKFTIIFAHCCFFGLISCNVQQINNVWLNDLINYILQDFIYQTVIITDKQQDVQVPANIDNIVTQISRKLPVTFLNMDQLLQFQKPNGLPCDISHFDKSNVIFIYINTFGYSFLGQSQKTTDMIRWLSCDTSEPKILVLQFRESNSDLEEQLRYVWQKKMLDFTFLEVVFERDKGSSFLPESLIQRLYYLHRLNPFTDKYTNEEYKSGIEFFPKKLKDMNGYKLRTSMIHLPPGSELIKNAAGQVIDVAGTEGLTLKALEKTLNFKAQLITAKSDTFGKILPNGSATLIYKELQEGNIEFISSGAYVFRSPMHKRVERTSAIKVEQFCALVPIIPADKTLLTRSTYLALLATAGVVLIVWITTLLMRFDPEILDPLKLVCMLMTVSLSREPSKLVERIIFGSLLIVSLAYSSTVFAQLTEILIKTRGEVPFESFDDLDKSGLHLLMHPNLLNRTFVDAGQNQALLNLKKKAHEFLLTNNCPGMLLRDRNVSCTGTESWTKMAVQMTRKQGDFTMKLAKPCFWSATMAFILQKGSPYLGTFNKVITKITESGLNLKWYDDYTRQIMFDANRKQGPYEKEKEKDGLAQQLWTVIYYGSLASFVVFVGEFILFKIQKEKHRIVRRLKIH